MYVRKGVRVYICVNIRKGVYVGVCVFEIERKSSPFRRLFSFRIRIHVQVNFHFHFNAKKNAKMQRCK